VDVVIAAALLVILTPFLLLIMLAIKLDSPGPALFFQRRRGLDDVEFYICKFRTMKVLEDGPVVSQAQRNDPRVTRMGRLLRKSNIDELPQLFNVLKGEMSLVGPRPHAVAHDEMYRNLIEDYALRLRVFPGITGWAQINGWRGETRDVRDMKERVRMDLWYIECWSIWLDLFILLQTPMKAFHKKAY
jgi:undecaprenyl-phosphate galactose phosphotransferase/putative colanic acid biosynthesis UDP-glucose lipid carrier transferase